MEAMNFKPEGSVISIHPLIITKKDSNRVPKISERIYRPGVLEGNWFEDSAPVTPVAKDQWASLCETSYRPYKTELLTRPKFEAWKQRISTQGIGARLLIDHHGTKYHNNWTTTNDLSFKILPQGQDRPLRRTFSARCKEWLPAQDYAKVYGNMTKYGLAEFMRHKWFIENKPTRPWRTNYQDDFPNYENASSVRFLKPKASLNEPDLRHLGFDLSAPHQSCPIAFKIESSLPYLQNVLIEEKAVAQC